MNFKSYAIATTILAASAAPALAANVSGGIIFGSGNANGDFTIGTGTYASPTFPGPDAVVELGLRAKLRFNESNEPENTFNYDGTDTYTFQAGTPPTGFSFAPGSPTTPVWNFEFSIVSELDFLQPSEGKTSLDALTYELRLDTDAGAGTSFLTFDPINMTYADHGLDDFNSANGGPTVASNDTDYDTLLSTMSRAQNSWSYEFFNDPGSALENFDPNDAGNYRIELVAFYDGNEVASTGINVNVVAGAVPLPAGLPLLLGGFGAFGLLARRRRKAS